MSNQRLLDNVRGFTFVEALAVVAIVGTVGALSVTNYNRRLVLSRQAQAKTLLSNAFLAERTFQLSAGHTTVCLSQIGGFPSNSQGQYYTIGFSAMQVGSYSICSVNNVAGTAGGPYGMEWSGNESCFRYNYSSTLDVPYNCTAAASAGFVSSPSPCDPYWGFAQEASAFNNVNLTSDGVLSQAAIQNQQQNGWCSQAPGTSDTQSNATQGEGAAPWTQDWGTLGGRSPFSQAMVSGTVYGGIPLGYQYSNTNNSYWAGQSAGTYRDFTFYIGAVGAVDNSGNYDVWELDSNQALTNLYPTSFHLLRFSSSN